MTARAAAGLVVGVALIVLGLLVMTWPAPAAPRAPISTPSTYGPPGRDGGAR